MKPYVPRILASPKESFFLLGPRGTGKSTWLLHVYPNAVRIDLLQPEQERLYLAAPERLREMWRVCQKEVSSFSMRSSVRQDFCLLFTP